MQVASTIEGFVPFQEELETSQFFTGGGRETVLAAIQAAFQDQVGIVTLIGEEGSGKTMLCKVLQEQWNDSPCKVVLLPQTVQSFEEIVRVTAGACELQYPAETDRDDARRIFLELVAALRAAGTSLLLICDEADMMYLATLERIRKILDDVNKDGGGLQLLFSGRESFAGHLQQLELCGFDSVAEKQFVLSAFDRDDVWMYLNFCVQRSRGGQQEVFSREAAARISSMGMGNLKRINRFAGEALQESETDNSLLVLVDHVKEGGVTGGGGKPAVLSRVSSLSKGPFSSRYLYGAAVVLFSLVVFFMFSSDDENEHGKDLGQSQKSVVTTPSAVEITAPRQDVSSPVKPKETEKREVVTPVQQEQVAIVSESVEDTLPVQPPAAEPAQQEPIVQVVDEKLSEEREVESAEPPVVLQHTPVEISPVEIVEKVGDDLELPELAGKMNISPEKFKRIIAIPQKRLSPKIVAAPLIERDPVLASLIIGGEKWQTGVDDARFSIQLMALTSDQAEENLKRIILKPEYQEIIDKLVLLKRPSDPPVVLLFYGSYPSMAEARNARNNMPIFLRKHHPYAVSVRGAVEKARVE